MKHQNEICKARSLFITRGILNREIIPDQIVYSWVRSKLHNISFELLNIKPMESSINILSLNKDTTSIIQYLRQIRLDYSMIYLINGDGRVLYQSNLDGFIIPRINSFLEEDIGTTAAGITVNTGEIAYVYGCEHYNKILTNYITESILIKRKDSENNVFIMVLTPVLHENTHHTLCLQLNKQFQKDEDLTQNSSVVSEKNVKKTTVNPTKTYENNENFMGENSTSNAHINNGCKEFTLSRIERDTIAEAITYYNGNLKRAAESLGIGRSTLYRKIKEFNLKRE